MPLKLEDLAEEMQAPTRSVYIAPTEEGRLKYVISGMSYFETAVILYSALNSVEDQMSEREIEAWRKWNDEV